MEKQNPYSGKFKLNLKNLPPIDPCSITYTKANQQVKYEKPNYRIAPRAGKPRPREEIKAVELDDVEKLKAADVSVCLTKHVDPNSVGNATTSSDMISKNGETSEREEDKFYQIESQNEGAPTKVSAKSKLLDVCVANNWKFPSFDCCKEEGPCHMKLYTFKVTVVIKSSNTILECFGAPQSKKKTAAEHAAEGALWYLKHLGYFPIKKRKD